ncbi:MAG: excinuclease ABC subunit UvrC [Candidatus Omnitrophica bacterium]|nr:excinuclease ABC subunit UvrC [Candidatus Omnitrophota bacterium]MCM8770914.1 excinuclease ABC subunit UvrC [Candidatus Omnitrophota bacterium]
MDIQKRIKELPPSPGVYIFKDKAGKILYIGKAANLKKRVNSYFTRYLSTKTQSMVSQIASIDYVLTPTEAAALIKEAAMVKEYLPRYNVALRDDKSFPLIRITDEDYPQISICRKKKTLNEKARYFGPYPNAGLLRQALKIIRQVFGFRTCKTLPKKICLYGRLNLCPAPCIGKIKKEDYKEIIDNIVLFLEGKQDALIQRLLATMKKLSQEKRYEEAARIRDQIRALSALKKESIEQDFISELEDFRQKIGLLKLPERIEALDISNILGKEATGSVISFFKGLPDKSNYRRFRIKEVKKINDYAMLREVVRRRYSRLKKENKQFPDLILIDGGRAHLLVAKKELSKLGLDIPLVSVAKEKENIYLLGRKEPLRLDFNSQALHLIQRIRDEAHRFALSYHRLLRRKKIINA